MRKILEKKWFRRKNVIPALFLGCFDRRFKGWRGEFAEEMGFEDAYPLNIPGGALDLARPKNPRDAEYLLEKIALVSKDIRIIVAMVHNECLACEENTDRAFYESILKEAGKKLRERFPQHEIILLFVDFDGEYIVDV